MFFTFEGIEGTGKSTQIRMLVEHLKRRGQDPLVTLEPGGSRVGRELRRMLLHLESRDITPETELFLYLADRAQHAAQVIRPALARGQVVLSDRYADSTVVYQGYGRGLEPRLLHQLNEVAVAGCWPDATILLDLEPEIGLNRAMARNLREGKAVEEGRFEAESLEFHRRVREGYLTWASLHQDRIFIVDATPGPDEVFDAVRAVMERARTRH